ncbi:MAG TPA: hypothetical protein V6C90_28060 [Coleofasciculaceae cyanobacterium]
MKVLTECAALSVYGLRRMESDIIAGKLLPTRRSKHSYTHSALST